MPTFMYVIEFVLFGGSFLVLLIMLPVAICCGEAVAELLPEYAPGQRRPAAPAAPAPVELMTPAAPVVVKLRYFRYSAEGTRASEEAGVCAICREVLEHGENCSEVSDCRHLFHRNCIDEWLKSKTTCPMCRGDVVERVSAADDMV
jgi:hypothetical protein